MRRLDTLLRTWLVATYAGWFLGFVVLVVLAEAWRITGTEAQFMVGIGLGAGVGYMQGRTLKILPPGRWMWSAILGMGIPFIAWDILGWLSISVPQPLQLFTLLGALLTGVFQAMLLRSHYERAMWWILASVVGWGILVGMSLIESGVMVLLVIAFGGLIVGAVTGVARSWIFGDGPAKTTD